MNSRFKDGMNLQGRVTIELISKDGKVKRKYQHNAITSLGKSLMMARGFNNGLTSPYGLGFGKTLIYALDEQLYSKAYMGFDILKPDMTINNLIVNDSGSVVDMSNCFIDMVANESTNIIGRAFAGAHGEQNSAKYGVERYPKGAFNLDKFAISRRYKYGAGCATGAFNKIVMAFGTGNNLKINGAMITKNIAPNSIESNVLLSASDMQNMFYILPGATGLTESDEILFSYPNSSNINNFKYSFTTGEITQVQSGVAATNFKNLISTLGTNEILCEAVSPNGDLTAIITNSRLYVLNNATATLVGTYKTISHLSYGASCYWKANDQVVVIESYTTEPGSYDQYAKAYLYTVDSSSVTLTSSANKNGVSEFSSDISKMYSNLSVNKTLKYKAGNYYIFRYGPLAVVCTDDSDVQGSMVSVLTVPRTVSPVMINNELKFISTGMELINFVTMRTIELQYPNTATTMFNQNYKIDYVNVNESGTTTQSTDWCKCGLFVSEAFGNVISAVELSEPITKGADDEMWISYEYKLV